MRIVRELADTSITVSGSELLAIGLGLLIVLALQVWAMVETVSRRRWGWLAVIWCGFPIGMIAWLLYGRRRTDAGTAAV